ncbi:MAG: succinylglutamate desuccinylase/aspartoacylase family protein, partial [Gammaproteobacteria bacterium]|nr:succinylglutamate desuccinylase/aspartoacylase family protein [Gammaproteobacteria bacterium]
MSKPRFPARLYKRASRLILAAVVSLAASSAGSLQILDSDVAAGERRLVWLEITESFAALPVRAPIHVVRGHGEGPTLCLFGGIHGDEVNGIEIVRRIIDGAEPEALRGTLIGAPIVNVPAFRLGSRYLPDRRDLNRHFPGDPSGSSAARIAHVFFQQIVRRCSHLVDYHTGSLRRSNFPQVRGDGRNEKVQSMLRAFGLVAIDKRGRKGTLRQAALNAGIPAVLFEAGQPNLFGPEDVQAGVDGTLRLMRALDMIDDAPDGTVNAPLYRETVWVRADAGGILLRAVEAGATVNKGDVLGTVHDPVEGRRSEIVSPVSGRAIGL